MREEEKMKTSAMGIMIIGMILACQNTTLTQPQDKNTIKSQGDSQITHIGSVPKPALPPIDLVTPTQIETATFALG
jgi:hypothetical protein